jgi:rhodanese-related sulfurtransferase
MQGNLPLISPSALKARLRGNEELALLDVREEGDFARGHLLLACPLPLSRLELRLCDLVPRRSTPIVLCDRRGELVERAAQKLRRFGYAELLALDGGVDAWAAAGLELFTGVNVPSKAFGELVEARCATPSISAEELKAAREGGEQVVVLDSRPMEEFRVMSIPGAIDCPGAELVYRIADLAPSPDTRIVVNCAGRTRSIIGAQSLINAGVANRVVALRNGTMGWHLAGFELERGRTRRPPEVSSDGLARARAMAEGVAEQLGVRSIDFSTLGRWRAESGERTLYLLDVRDPEEYEAGHLPASRPAPGGQLVQKTDSFMGTRGARVVLIDDIGVRATMTASWLVQMGLEDVFVLRDGLAGPSLEKGRYRPSVLGLDDDAPEATTPAELSSALERGEALVVDLATSLRYRAGHIPGAWFAVRSRLSDSAARLPSAPTIVLTSDDGVLARLAAPELQALTGSSVKVLDGGTAAWSVAGLPLADGMENLADECDDVFWRPYDHDQGAEQAMNDYLAWEHGLIEQIERDGTVRFRVSPA